MYDKLLEAAAEANTEIKNAVSALRTVVRKYAGKGSDKQEMIDALNGIEKDLKAIVKSKSAKTKKVNEAVSTSGKINITSEFVYAVWFIYDGGELFYVRAITGNLDDAYEAFNEQVKDLDDYGADDCSDILLVKLPNTTHILDLLEKCSDEDNYEHFQNEADELDSYVLEYIDSRL